MQNSPLQNLPLTKNPSDVNPERVILEKKKISDAIEIILACFKGNTHNLIQFKEGYESMAFFDTSESKKLIFSIMNQFMIRYENSIKDSATKKNITLNLQKKMMNTIIESIDIPDSIFDKEFLHFLVGAFTKILEKNFYNEYRNV